MSRFTDIFDATMSGTVEDMQYFIEKKGVDVNTREKNNSTPLHQTAYYGNIEAVKFLVSKGANIHAVDKNGFTPLHKAVFAGDVDVAEHIEVMKFLVSEGANVNAKTKEGNKPVDLAKDNGHTEMVEYLKIVGEGKSGVVIVIGAALMFVLMRFAQINIGVESAHINFGIAILAAFAATFGPIVGLLIGLIGVALTGFSWGGIWWSGVISSAIFGCVIGYFWKSFKIKAGGFGLKECLRFNVIQIITNILVWIFIARTLDMSIFKAPFSWVIQQGFTTAAIYSAVVLVFGSLLCFGYSKYKSKKLKKGI